MTTRRRAVDTVLALTAAAGPVGYPLLLRARGRGRTPEPPRPESWPAVSVVVAAFREASVIEAKVADTLANGYPGPLEVIVVADDDVTAESARRTEATVLAPGRRLGKSSALNLGVAHAAGDVIVITDANAFLVPDALRSLARWFEDPSIGAVAGEKRVAGAGEGLYWRYESWLKTREFAAGTTMSVVGELAAVRRTAWRPIPDDVALDDLWIALDVAASGLRIAYDPAAAASEEPNERLADDWERRTRNLAALLHLLLRRRSMLGRGSPVALELWGHKVLRSTAGPLAHLVLLVRAAGRVRQSPVAAAFVIGHGVAAAALAAQDRGRRMPGPVRAGAQVAFLQAVALGGMVRYLRGDRAVRWPKPERAAQAPPSPS